jgi:cell division protein ZapA
MAEMSESSETSSEPAVAASAVSTGAKAAVNIRLLEREYRIAVSEAEREDFLAAAARLDARMRDIREQGKVLAADRIAVMAALESSLEAVKLAQAAGALQAAAVPRPVDPANTDGSGAAGEAVSTAEPQAQVQAQSEVWPEEQVQAQSEVWAEAQAQAIQGAEPLEHAFLTRLHALSERLDQALHPVAA